MGKLGYVLFLFATCMYGVQGQLLERKECKVGDKTYQAGEKFTADNCMGRCTCVGPHWGCVSMCPPMAVNCPLGTRLQYKPEKVAGTDCFCQRPFCEPKAYCTFNGKVYREGTRFIEKCNMQCVCRNGRVGCIPLCPVFRVRCGKDQFVTFEEKKVAGIPCKCKRPKCTKMNQRPVCKFEDKKYKPGEKFVDKNCKAYCTCHGPGYGCVSLCPPMGIRCPPGQKVVNVDVPVIFGCTCPRPKCVPNA